MNITVLTPDQSIFEGPIKSVKNDVRYWERFCGGIE